MGLHEYSCAVTRTLLAQTIIETPGSTRVIMPITRRLLAERRRLSTCVSDSR